ncbi:uncharacterized protein LOC126237078 [Schistocerca nitens]|uniref:uncharacterized protein LOC126237078 n=1 Tax=Schistocerca nitens TaxID=7011 RepID=UPI002117DE72|nr:uncharacterized protein LOC126237078 [Schistocerca nitens]
MATGAGRAARTASPSHPRTALWTSTGTPSAPAASTVCASSLRDPRVSASCRWLGPPEKGSVRHLTCTFPLQIVFLSDSFAFQFTLADSSNMLDAQSQLKAHAQTARSWWRRSTHARNPGAHARGGAVSGSWWRVWRLADALLHNGC